MTRTVIVRTSTQDIHLEVPILLTLEEVLRTKHIPPNLFQGYIKNIYETKPIPLYICVKDIPPHSEIILQCIRNTDLQDVLPQKTFYKKTRNPVTAISTLNLGGKKCTQTVYELSSKQAREIVKNKILEFIKINSNAGLVVAGISGGGDSNTLAEGLKDYSIINNTEKKILFFTLVFEPLWPQSAADRASELCRRNGMEHQIYGAKEIEKLLDMRRELSECYHEFCEKFGNKTSHFFGTYLISLVARKLCRKYETNEYILGFNREDVLAEMLFSIMNGQKPLAFPVRQFDEVRLLMPLWEVPKLVLDACYPKYSLSNYQEREDTATFQRNIIYYLAHGIEDVYENLGLSLMLGIQKLFENNWAELKHDEDLDLYVSSYAKKPKTENIKSFFSKYFNI